MAIDTDDKSTADLELEGLAKQAETEDYQPQWEEVSGEDEASYNEPSTGELMTGVLSIGFALLASRKGKHWELSVTEADETGQALGAVLDKYFPDLSGAGVEITAVMTVGMILLPRMAADKAIEAARLDAERQQPKHASEAA